MDIALSDLKDPEKAAAIISQLDSGDLHLLNKLIVERIKNLRSDSASEHMARFRIGQRVSFTHKDGEQVIATVIRLNKKTASLEGDDGERWNVSPQLLEHMPDIIDNSADANLEPKVSSIGQPIDQPKEWVGRIVKMPAFVTGEGIPYQPNAFILMDDQGIVRGTNVFPDDDIASSCIDCLRTAIEKPEFGEPGAPDSIRLTDQKLVTLLREAFTNIEFVQGETPELDEVIESFTQSMSEFADVPTYLSGGAKPEAVGALFEAAAQLYKFKPWLKVPHDQCLIGISIPSLGIHDAAMSVIGQQRQSFGFLLFPTLTAHERYIIGVAEIRLENEPEIPSYIALTFIDGADLEIERRKEVTQHQWKVLNANAYPDVFTPDEERVVRPITPDDMTLLEGLSRALPQLLKASPKRSSAWKSRAKPERFDFTVDTQAGQLSIEMTMPFDYIGVMPRSNASSDTIAQLMQLSRSYDVLDMKKVNTLHQLLNTQFSESPEYKQLNKQDVDASSLIGEFAASYLEESIATLHIDGLREILFEIIPAKVVYDAEDAKPTINSIRAFYLFLKREHGLIQADACIDFLDDRAIDVLEEALSDSDNFGIGKSMLSQAKDNGFDTDTPEGFENWLNTMNIDGSALPELPSLSSKKAPSSKKRKDKRKTARKARKKNR